MPISACFVKTCFYVLPAVRDSIYYQYVLNGNGRQFPSKDFVVDGAWFKYTNNGGHENLSSKGPVHNNVNIMVSKQFKDENL